MPLESIAFATVVVSAVVYNSYNILILDVDSMCSSRVQRHRHLSELSTLRPLFMGQSISKFSSPLRRLIATIIMDKYFKRYAENGPRMHCEFFLLYSSIILI